MQGRNRMDKSYMVIIAIGIILFLWFGIPIFAGVFNIGNVTGMVIAAVLTGYGVFHVRMHQWIDGIWQNRGGKVALAAVLLIIVCMIGVAAVETVGIVRSARNQPPANTNAVVLGCSVKGTRPSTVLKERLDAAYEYLLENPEALCVLSGGQGVGEDISEAECMYRYLTEKGIPGERLLLENQSTTTEENLRFSMQLLEEQGIEGSITIVTSEFHEYRANQVAERLGITSYSTPSHTFILYLPTFYVRELYGILYYMVR